jgi:hypothetical protein
MKPNDGKALWAWMTQMADGSVSLVGAYLPSISTHMPLVSRSRDITERLRPLAKEHAKITNQRVWLREFTGAIDHEEA